MLSPDWTLLALDNPILKSYIWRWSNAVLYQMYDTIICWTCSWVIKQQDSSESRCSLSSTFSQAIPTNNLLESATWEWNEFKGATREIPRKQITSWGVLLKLVHCKSLWWSCSLPFCLVRILSQSNCVWYILYTTWLSLTYFTYSRFRGQR